MCGIAGVLHSESKGAVDPAVLRAMNASLRHRGPDDEGYRVEGRVGLAMRRLSIIDLEGGHQPISNETGTVWTVFNGEIYNFAELREFLTGRGHYFQSRTDTEVIVHLYEEFGEDFVRKLRGMFAIALWDSERRKFLLIRDRLGIKPLHYWFRDGTLVFASEIKALLEYPEISREISLAALSDYLSFLYIPSPGTIYRDIQKLPPGEMLCLENGALERRSYWDMNFEPDYSVSEAEWAERVRNELSESVRLHLVSDVPLGAFLSGGIDSSAIVAMMKRHASGPVKTYSIGFQDHRYNELPYAREVARHCGAEHHEEIVEADAFGLLPKVLAGFDEPFADSSALPTYLVSRFARKDVTVALSGDGGDELFGGYLWTRKEVWLEKYRRFPGLFKSVLRKITADGSFQPLMERGVWNAFRRFVYDAHQDPPASFARRAMSFQPWMKERLFLPWVKDAIRTSKSENLIRAWFEKAGAKSVVDKFLFLDSKIYLPDDLLTKVDRMSMLHSLEVRVPILDHRLVELACAIPFSMKIKGQTTKYIFKKAIRGLVPESILRQRKQGFAVPIQRWFREDLHGFAKKILLGERSASGRYFDLNYVRWLLEEHAAGRQRFGTQLYALAVFEIWSRMTEESRTALSSSNLTLTDLAP
ncbi:MAG: asparagine synthase (glutamine-hydrolyzing) [Candidatus Omnitrophica bacterium]|nr:asparagine synthase (glutamine-hydrolyzing) [Candidatus Omnitrophota bacterium]